MPLPDNSTSNKSKSLTVPSDSSDNSNKIFFFPLRKYFLVYEGSETEAIYFDAISSMREDVGISPLIELIPIIRSYSENGWSNPKKILDRIIENLEESRTNQISYESCIIFL